MWGMGGDCWEILRIFVKKGMENRGIFARLKALLIGERRMRLSEYLDEYRTRNLAERRGHDNIHSRCRHSAGCCRG